MTDGHGTYAGYNAHMRLREAPCTPCRDAASRYATDRRRRAGNQPNVQAHLAEATRSERDRIRTAILTLYGPTTVAKHDTPAPKLMAVLHIIDGGA